MGPQLYPKIFCQFNFGEGIEHGIPIRSFPIHLFGEIISLTRNPKIHPKWVKSSNFGWKLMKYWLKQPFLTQKVGLLLNTPFFD